MGRTATGSCGDLLGGRATAEREMATGLTGGRTTAERDMATNFYGGWLPGRR